jgi:hypothetical protein
VPLGKGKAAQLRPSAWLKPAVPAVYGLLSVEDIKSPLQLPEQNPAAHAPCSKFNCVTVRQAPARQGLEIQLVLWLPSKAWLGVLPELLGQGFTESTEIGSAKPPAAVSTRASSKNKFTQKHRIALFLHSCTITRRKQYDYFWYCIFFYAPPQTKSIPNPKTQNQ